MNPSIDYLAINFILNLGIGIVYYSKLNIPYFSYLSLPLLPSPLCNPTSVLDFLHFMQPQMGKFIR